VVSRGRTTGLIECDVRDEAGRLLARASSTCFILTAEKAAPAFASLRNWNPE